MLGKNSLVFQQRLKQEKADGKLLGGEDFQDLAWWKYGFNKFNRLFSMTEAEMI